MDKQIITFSANEQNLIRIGGEYHYSSNKVSYIGAHFDLGANWDGFDSVRAVWFTDRINGISTVLDGEGNCTVPTEVLKKKDRVFVNLVGSIVSNGELTDRLTTYPAVALVVDSKAKVDSTETAPVTPSQFEQFVSIVQDAVANIKDIVSTTLNADYTLTFAYSDGTSYTTPSIRGERGPQGADGADGTDGNGIASAVLNSNYTLTLTFTDGTSYTTPSIRGAQGPKGDPGDVSQAQLDAAVSDLKSDLSGFENYINPNYIALQEFGDDYFFQSGKFSITGGTATIDDYDPLTVTNTSSGVARSSAIIVDANQGSICIDITELSKKSMAGSVGFFTSSSAYISQSDFAVTDGKAFKSVTIPNNAAKCFLFLNFYTASTYTLETINMYYGTQKIDVKTFDDVFKSKVGLLGMKWGAYGDSLTASATLGVGVKNYTNYVAESFGLDLVNLGVAGTGYMNDNGISKAFWQRYTDIPSDTDVLTIFGSLNDLDLAYNNVGGLKDSNTTTLYGCMNTFLDGIYTRNVGMRVGMILPTPWQWMNRRYPGEITTLKTEQYINALIEFAKFNSIPVLNLFDESGMHPWDESFRTTYYKNSDGTHPNSLGHYRFIYPKVKAFIEQVVAK